MSEKQRPIHSACGQPMVKRGRRNKDGTQRFWCPVCNQWEDVRGAAKRLRSSEKYSVEAVVLMAAYGMSIHHMAQATGMGWVAVKRRLNRMEAASRARFAIRPPVAGKAWMLVDLPAGSHAEGRVAIGRIRRSLRLVDWEKGRNATTKLVKRLGSEPASVDDQDAARWIQSALGASCRSWDEAEQRLWVILAQSNGWNLENG